MDHDVMSDGDFEESEDDADRAPAPKKQKT